MSREPTAEQIVRDVLIEAVDIIPAGTEPHVGWSAVLAERICAAMNAEPLTSTPEPSEPVS